MLLLGSCCQGLFCPSSSWQPQDMVDTAPGGDTSLPWALLTCRDLSAAGHRDASPTFFKAAVSGSCPELHPLSCRKNHGFQVCSPSLTSAVSRNLCWVSPVLFGDSNSHAGISQVHPCAKIPSCSVVGRAASKMDWHCSLFHGKGKP